MYKSVAIIFFALVAIALASNVEKKDDLKAEGSFGLGYGHSGWCWPSYGYGGWGWPSYGYAYKAGGGWRWPSGWGWSGWSGYY